jgi:uncharacterized iron-regulated membrane protein
VVTHYELHAGMTGFWIVGLATTGMLVTLISGIVIHRRFFKDFFTFRPGQGQRSWLDAHNLSSVMTLPFQIMIAYTGLAMFYYAYMPAAIGYHFGLPGGLAAQFDQASPYFRALRPAAPDLAREEGVPARLVELPTLLAAAEAQLGQVPSRIVVERPGRSSALVRIYAPPAKRALERTILTPAEHMAAFDGATGTGVTTPAGEAQTLSGAVATYEVMSSLHQATFGGALVRWLYFLSGIAGTAMMLTGVILFTAKRRRMRPLEAGQATHRAHEAADAINLVCSVGLVIACISYFWANRLISGDANSREAWEARVFFATWAAAIPHALLRAKAAAWIEQLGVAAVLCLLLPVLGVLTSNQGSVAAAMRGDWKFAGVELTAVAAGILLAGAVGMLRARQRTFATPRQIATPAA